MADYYELLGVSRDATKDEIRQAYQAKRAEAEASGGSGSRVAELNEAWQTLADPYQRGRYDARLDAGAAGGEVLPDTAEVVDAAAPPPRRRGLFAPPDGRAAPPPPEPTIPIPAGMHLADQRTRLNAMLFDLAVLILLFIVSTQVVGASILRNAYPDETDRLDELTDELLALVEVRDATEEVDDRRAALDDAQGADARAEAEADLEEAQADLDDARTGEDTGADFERAVADCSSGPGAVEIADPAAPTVDELEACEELLQARYDDVEGELWGANLAILGGAIVVCVAYLVLPGLRSGQTLGKRMRRIRVVQQDGSRLTLRGSLLRYGGPVVVAIGVGVILRLGVLGLALALVGVLMWMRNPNRQGLHDRLAKTIVVDAS